MVEKIQEDIYSISVPLPHNPLRELNCYVICGKGRNLMIDTGFNRPECLEALKNGVKELGIDMNETDLFLTHLHSDHTGLANQIVSPYSRIFMNSVDSSKMNYLLTDPSGWEDQAELFIHEGFPLDELAEVQRYNPAKRFQPSDIVRTLPVSDGTVLKCGGVSLRCIVTPGHTPGHTCLYWEDRQILFSGDHVLFDITPNISIWGEHDDPLGQYFMSLGRIENLPVKLCLPGHRSPNTNMKGRIHELLNHHAERLKEAAELVKKNPGMGAYQIARRMTWSIHSNGWDDFPVGQKWFAVGEAMTHLTVLANLGVVRREVVGSKVSYFYDHSVDLHQAVWNYARGKNPLEKIC